MATVAHRTSGRANGRVRALGWRSGATAARERSKTGGDIGNSQSGKTAGHRHHTGIYEHVFIRSLGKIQPWVTALRAIPTPPAQLDADSAASVAATLQALATPSRLRILTRLRHGACSVNDLSAAVEMEQSAVSHQLRLLRAMGLVTGARNGRSVIYALYDNHVAMLLDEAVYHIEHLGLGVPAQPSATA